MTKPPPLLNFSFLLFSSPPPHFSFLWTKLVNVILLSLEFPRLKSELFAILNATCTTCFQSLWSEELGSQASGNHGRTRYLGSRKAEPLRDAALTSHGARDLVLGTCVTSPTCPGQEGII